MSKANNDGKRATLNAGKVKQNLSPRVTARRIKP